MIDSASALVIVGAALQAVPVGRVAVEFVIRRSRAAIVGRALSALPSTYRDLRSSS